MPIILAPANDRGFLRGEFTDRYGEKCSIQKSSLASEDCIWLGQNEPTVDQQGRMCGCRMHLNQEMVADLLPTLMYFVETGELPSEGAALEPLRLQKRPVAFRVKLNDQWLIFEDERAAQQLAELNEIEYQGLYVRDGT